MQPAAITFAVPYYENAAYLRETLESVRRQTIADWRAVVCDDSRIGAGDTSEAAAIVAAYADPRITYVRHPAPLGMAANWNACLDAATTPYVTVLHADDRLLPGYAAGVVALLNANPDATAVFCAATIIDARGRRRATVTDHLKRLLAAGGGRRRFAGEDGHARLLAANTIICPTLCYRTALLGSARFEPEWGFVADLRLTLGILRRGGRIVGTAEVLFEYRRHEGSTTAALTRSLRRFEDERRLLSAEAELAEAMNWPKSVHAGRSQTGVRCHLALWTLKDLCSGQPAAAAAKARLLATWSISAPRGAASTGPATEPLSLRAIAVAAALITLAGIAAYANSFGVPFQFDDLSIGGLGHHSVRELRPLAILLYNPTRSLGLLTFAVNHRLHGEAVWGYHAVNLLIHVLTGLVLFALLADTAPRRPLDAPKGASPFREGGLRMPALFCALIFVVHPLNTQAVTYIVQRYTSLAALLYLSALWAWNRCLGSRPGLRGRLLAAGVIGCAALGSLTKPIIATLPAMMLLMGWLLRGLPVIGIVRHPVWLTSAVTIAALHLIGLTLVNPELIQGNLAAPMPRMHYLLTQVNVVRTYLRLLVWPTDQSVVYTYPVTTGAAGGAFWLSLALHAGLLTIAWHARHRAPRITLGVFAFYLLLAPDSSIIPLPDVIFEHRVYLPMAGLAFAGAALLDLAARRHPGLSRSRPVAVCALAAVLGLAWATSRRNRVWATPESLWNDALAKQPGNTLAHLNLAKAAIARGDREAAINQLRQAADLTPDEPTVWIALGKVLGNAGRFKESGEALAKAATLDQSNPEPWHLVPLALSLQNQPAAALAAAEACRRVHPGSSLCVARQVAALTALGRRDEALSLADEALSRWPDDETLRRELRQPVRAPPPDGIDGGETGRQSSPGTEGP